MRQGVLNAAALAAGILTPVAGSALLAQTSPGVRGLRAIAAGLTHAAGITGAGTVVTWGTNQYYQLGRGRNAPMPAGGVPGLTGVQSLAAVNATTTAVLSSGRIMTWGGVRPWTRPDGEWTLSPSPILLWVDGLDQP